MGIKGQRVKALICEYMFTETVGNVIFIIIICLIVDGFQKAVLAFQMAGLSKKRLVQLGFFIDRCV